MKIFSQKTAEKVPDRRLYGCCEGLVIDIRDSDDDIVSSGVLGDGYAVFPRYDNEKSVVGGHMVEIGSPVTGRVVDITHKPEVMIIKTEDNLKVLVNFSSFSAPQVYMTVRAGESLTAGQHIADLKVEDNNDKAFFVIVENSDKFEKFDILKGKTAADKPAAKYEM